jgi:hypothetical protein
MIAHIHDGVSPFKYVVSNDVIRYFISFNNLGQAFKVRLISLLIYTIILILKSESRVSNI